MNHMSLQSTFHLKQWFLRSIVTNVMNNSTSSLHLVLVLKAIKDSFTVTLHTSLLTPYLQTSKPSTGQISMNLCHKFSVTTPTESIWPEAQPLTNHLALLNNGLLHSQMTLTWRNKSWTVLENQHRGKLQQFASLVVALQFHNLYLLLQVHSITTHGILWSQFAISWRLVTLLAGISSICLWRKILTSLTSMKS